MYLYLQIFFIIFLTINLNTPCQLFLWEETEEPGISPTTFGQVLTNSPDLHAIRCLIQGSNQGMVQTHDLSRPLNSHGFGVRLAHSVSLLRSHAAIYKSHAVDYRAVTCTFASQLIPVAKVFRNI